MNMKIPMVAISAFVVVIVLGAVLMPVLGDATTTEDTYKNEGYFFVEEFSGDDITYSATWDHTKPSQITVNGVDIPIDVGTTQVSLILDGNFFLRYFPAANSVSLYYGNTGLVSASVNDGTDMNVSYSAGYITFANTAATPVTRTIEVGTFYSIAESGDYVMKKANVDAYMNADSMIYGCGRTGSGDSILGTLVSGTIDDVDVTVWRGDYTISNVNMNATEVNGHEDLYKFTSVTFTATPTDPTLTTHNVTYSYVVVPYEITAERTVHLTDSENAILLVIPALLIVAIIIGVLALAIRSRE